MTTKKTMTREEAHAAYDRERLAEVIEASDESLEWVGSTAEGCSGLYVVEVDCGDFVLRFTAVDGSETGLGRYGSAKNAKRVAQMHYLNALAR